MKNRRSWGYRPAISVLETLSAAPRGFHYLPLGVRVLPASVAAGLSHLASLGTGCAVAHLGRQVTILIPSGAHTIMVGRIATLSRVKSDVASTLSFASAGSVWLAV